MPTGEGPDAGGKRYLNIVELMADDEQAFDQPCRHGNRLGGHSVYCHHPDPEIRRHKCLYRWCTPEQHAENECGGYEPNPGYVPRSGSVP